MTRRPPDRRSTPRARPTAARSTRPTSVSGSPCASSSTGTRDRARRTGSGGCSPCEDDGWIVVDREGHPPCRRPDDDRRIPARPRPPAPRTAEPTGVQRVRTDRAGCRPRAPARPCRPPPAGRAPPRRRTHRVDRTGRWARPRGEPRAGRRTRAPRGDRDRRAPLGPWVWSRTATFTFRGIWLRQTERWFLTRTDGLDADDVPLDDLATARRALVGARRADRARPRPRTPSVLAPRALPEHLARCSSRAASRARPVDVGA
jgi:hypothetical protein